MPTICLPPDPDPGAEDDLASALVRAACLTYGDDDRGQAGVAQALLAENPDLGHTSIHTAAAVGDVEAAAELLSADPRLATAEGGPFRWAPLMYAAYSRLASPDPAHSTVEVARLLLAAGADADTGYLGGESLFTALTGALGGGEDDQPPHHEGLALARLLLEAGADPNDTQTLYNRGMGGSADDTVAHLELLVEFGLGRGTGSVWDAPLGDTPAPNARLLDEELLTAGLRGLRVRARFLLDQGVAVDAPAPGHPFYGDHTAYRLAVLHGHADVAELLAAAGAEQSLDPLDRVVGALMTGSAQTVEQITVDDPSLLERARREQPGLVVRAAEAGHGDAVRLLVERGWDVNVVQRITALHQAAFAGDLPMVRLLVDLGADPNIEDSEFEATPMGWATHGEHQDVVDYLAPLTDPTS